MIFLLTTLLSVSASNTVESGQELNSTSQEDNAITVVDSCNEIPQSGNIRAWKCDAEVGGVPVHSYWWKTPDTGFFMSIIEAEGLYTCKSDSHNVIIINRNQNTTYSMSTATELELLQKHLNMDWNESEMYAESFVFNIERANSTWYDGDMTCILTIFN